MLTISPSGGKHDAFLSNGFIQPAGLSRFCSALLGSPDNSRARQIRRESIRLFCRFRTSLSLDLLSAPILDGRISDKTDSAGWIRGSHRPVPAAQEIFF